MAVRSLGFFIVFHISGQGTSKAFNPELPTGINNKISKKCLLFYIKGDINKQIYYDIVNISVLKIDL